MRVKGRTHLIYERSTGLYFANVDGKPEPTTLEAGYADLYHPMDVNVVGASYYGDAFQPIMITSVMANASTYMQILGRKGGKKSSDRKKKTSARNGRQPQRRFGVVK